jgi:outer membrane protein assembly factor BamB
MVHPLNSVRSLHAKSYPIFLAAFVVAAGGATLSPLVVRAQEHHGFNKKGNILIADQFNNRVIEINRHHKIVWQFGDGSSVPGPNSVVGTNDAERVGRLTLIAGTGTPPGGAEPSCPDAVNGCPDNRVMLVNRHGKIVWQYGQAGVTGSGDNQLNTPVQATYLPNHHILITDQSNERVIEVTPGKEIVWQYGTTGVIGSDVNQLSNPNSAQLLENGHILIADENNNRVIEVTHAKKIIWQFPNPVNTALLNGAAFASRLPNGNTLITDSNNNRIIEVTHSGSVVFTYPTNTRPGSVANPLPTRAVRLRNGDTLISDQYNDQVIEIDPEGEIVFDQGEINTDGNGFDLLGAPYDAKVIGDYTGLTPPTRDNDEGNNHENE